MGAVTHDTEVRRRRSRRAKRQRLRVRELQEMLQNKRNRDERVRIADEFWANIRG